MIPMELTLSQLREKKAKSYFDMYRDKKTGLPNKTLELCYLEAGEDYGPVELSQYNVWYKAHWNQIMDTPKQIAWLDGTYDDKRLCSMCETACKNPVHSSNAIGKPDSYAETKSTFEGND